MQQDTRLGWRQYVKPAGGSLVLLSPLSLSSQCSRDQNNYRQRGFGMVVKNPQSWWPRGLMLEKGKLNYLKKNALEKFVWYSGWKNYNKIEIVKNYALYDIWTNVKILLVWIIHMKCDLEGFLFVAALFCIKHVNYPQKFYWIDYII